MSILLPGDDRPQKKPYDFPVHARSGWEIPQPEEEVPLKSIEELRIKANELMRYRRGLTLRSAAPFPYNCVGMIFASRRAVIEIDHIYSILREDGYRRIQYNEIMTGDIVLYKDRNDPTHVAMITQIEPLGQTLNVKVLSKWGLLAEFEHFLDNVPERYGKSAEFYSERQL